MRLDLNLAREGERPRGGRGAGWWAAAALLLAAASTAQGLYYRSLVRSIAPVEERLRALEAEARRLEAQQADGLPAATRQALAALPAQVETYNRILVAAAFSWTGLLMQLEASLPPNVGLTAIQPDPVSSTVTLQGLAQSFADITAFVHRLEQQAAFRDVQLLRHNEQGLGGAEGPPLQDFTIRIEYGAPGRQGPRPPG